MKFPRKHPGPGPSTLEDHVGFWLRYVSNHVSGRFRTLVESQGCTVSEWVALRTLYDDEGASATELIHALGMTKGAVSKIVDRLEKKGLARRQFDERRARGQRLVLTRKGLELVPRLAALADENDAHFFGHLERREQQALVRACKALVEHHRLAATPVS